MAFAEPSVMAPACGDINKAPEAITAAAHVKRRFRILPSFLG
jgi:hypothetical protein